MQLYYGIVEQKLILNCNSYGYNCIYGMTHRNKRIVSCFHPDCSHFIDNESDDAMVNPRLSVICPGASLRGCTK